MWLKREPASAACLRQSDSVRDQAGRLCAQPYPSVPIGMRRAAASANKSVRRNRPQYRVLVVAVSLPHSRHHSAALADQMACADQVPANDGALRVLLRSVSRRRLFCFRSDCGRRRRRPSAATRHRGASDVGGKPGRCGTSLFCHRLCRTCLAGSSCSDIYGGHDSPDGWASVASPASARLPSGNRQRAAYILALVTAGAALRGHPCRSVGSSGCARNRDTVDRVRH